jgi:hypothetical protein
MDGRERSLSTVRNGAAERIVAYVAAHPGCTRAELMAGCGVADPRWSMPTYCCKAGLIHVAGPRSWQRYYPTAEQAQSKHAKLCADADARRKAKASADDVLQNLRRLMLRRQAGCRTIACEHRIKLAPGVTLAPDVRITIAPPMRDRWQA